MNNALAVVRYLILRYAVRDQEVMGALFIDVRTASWARARSSGEPWSGPPSSPGRSCAGPGRGAAGVLLWHTHPSGDPCPSMEDIRFTRRLAEAGAIVGVRLLDHLILGGTNRWVSLRTRGVLR